MQRVSALILITGLLLISQNSYSADLNSEKLSPRLDIILNSLKTAPADSQIKVLVILENSGVQDQIAKSGISKSITRHELIKSVTGQLRNYRPAGYNEIESFLKIHSSTKLEKYWIVPAFSAVLSVGDIKELEKFENVKLIVEDQALTYDPPIESLPAPSLSTAVSNHLQMLNVPQLWSRGLTGRGRLVCSFDTGVEVGHPALAAKWHGHNSALSASWFSVVEPDSLPNDNVGHGTHTMGIMCGSAGADTIGVAFDAQWISAAVIDQGRPLASTITDILAAFQWALNPDGDINTTNDVPDVILNSWGVPKGLFAPCDATFWTVIDNVEAAGIVTIFAAGNEGPNIKTMRSPADRASTALNSFAVGSVDNNKVVGNFSSRGPSSCDTSQHKPEVVAPGVLIRSSVKGGGYGYMTGTSMSAPFIAGLVALVRQFNPDATVSQIKNAILLSCEDLGPIGDDNTYGQGLPNASKILDFIPPPSVAIFSIFDQSITETSIPFPGDSFHLRLTLNKEAGNVDQITGTLSCINVNEALILADQSGFFFGGTGNSAISAPEFLIQFNDNLIHGQEVAFCLELSDGTGAVFDSLYFNLTAGIEPNGTISVQATNRLRLSVSDFGQYGFGPGSIYNAGGSGFCIDGGINVLYEAGLIVGRNTLQLASSIRDSLGELRPSEFGVLEPLETSPDRDGGSIVSATMRDNLAEITIPVTVIQKSKTSGDPGSEGFIIFEYWLYNNSIENLTSIYFGFVSDFDLGPGGDYAYYDPSYEMAWQQNANGKAVGIVALQNVNGFSYVSNGEQKTGFNRQQKFNTISTNSYSSIPGSASDIMSVTKSGPFNIAPGDSVKIALAIVIGNGTADLYQNALKARENYDIATDLGDEGESNLPDEFALHQNYPNPFNPSTTISFDLNKKQDIELTIYNLLGQKVRTLYSGSIDAGSHRIEWDATDDSHQKISSGIYFYKLAAHEQTASRKMMLLK